MTIELQEFILVLWFHALCTGQRPLPSNIKSGADRIVWTHLNFLLYLQHFSFGSSGTWLFHRKSRKQIFNQQPFIPALIIFFLTLTLWDTWQFRVILNKRILFQSWFHEIITVIAIAQSTLVDSLTANCASASKGQSMWKTKEKKRHRIKGVNILLRKERGFQCLILEW